MSIIHKHSETFVSRWQFTLKMRSFFSIMVHQTEFAVLCKLNTCISCICHLRCLNSWVLQALGCTKTTIDCDLPVIAHSEASVLLLSITTIPYHSLTWPRFRPYPPLLLLVCIRLTQTPSVSVLDCICSSIQFHYNLYWLIISSYLTPDPNLLY